MPSLGPVAGRLVRVLLGGTLGLVAGEVFVRAGGYDPLQDPRVAPAANEWTQSCVELVDGPGYRRAPGRCGANRYGLDDEDRPYVDDPAELRIAAVGDSITGNRVYTDLLEVLLAKELGRPAAVFNFGVAGYATEDEAWTVARFVPEAQPHGIILQFTPNDYQGSVVYLRGPDGVQVVDAVAGRHGALWHALFSRSAAFRLVALLTARRPTVEERAPAVHAALAEVAADADRMGIPVWLLVVPTLTPPDRTPPPDAWAAADVAAAGAAVGMTVVDLRPAYARVGADAVRLVGGPAAWSRLDQLGLRDPLPATLRGMSQRSLLLLAADETADTTHPNFYGHALAAEALADAMLPTLRAR